MIFPEIYLSAWINHACFGGFMYENTSLSMAVLKFKIQTCERPGMWSPGQHFWTPLQENMTPYIYAGPQEKWVWMRNVSNDDPIPFTHRTLGVTKELTLHGTKVFWRVPTHKRRNPSA